MTTLEVYALVMGVVMFIAGYVKGYLAGERKVLKKHRAALEAGYELARKRSKA